MFCSKCGYKVDGSKFCPNCGNKTEQIINQQANEPQVIQPVVNSLTNQTLQNNLQVQPTVSFQQNVNGYQNTPIYQPIQSSKKTNQIIIGVCVACSFIIIAVVFVLLTSNNDYVYFSDDNNTNDSGSGNIVENSDDNKPSNKLGVTSVNHDNKYTLNVATTEQSVLDMVVKDSEKEKEGCPKEIIEIENRIINNYEIPAVNLCELDLEVALELENVVKYIYNDFPAARGYLTHLSLGNLDSSQASTIAFFQWVFMFTESTIDSHIGYKSRIILNSSYYLDLNKFKAAVTHSSNSGHFPKNATIYSPLVHEFAHYLSFIATNNYYRANPRIILKETDFYESYYSALLDFSEGTHSKRMIEEAYNNYKMKTGTRWTLDEFRASISQYAVAKDNTGNYIWDETIAESLHDVYLNGDNAAPASKEVVAVLRKYVEM